MESPVDDANNNPTTTVSSQSQKGYCYWIQKQYPPNVRPEYLKIKTCSSPKQLKKYKCLPGDTKFVDNHSSSVWKAKWDKKCSNKMKCEPGSCGPSAGFPRWCSKKGHGFAFCKKNNKEPLTGMESPVDDANNNPTTTVSSQSKKGYCFWPKSSKHFMARIGPWRGPPCKPPCNCAPCKRIKKGYINECLFKDDIIQNYKIDEEGTCKNGTLIIDNKLPKHWKSKWKSLCTNKKMSSKTKPPRYGCRSGKKFAFCKQDNQEPLMGMDSPTPEETTTTSPTTSLQPMTLLLNMYQPYKQLI